jgi:hypothetical protein
MSNLQKLIRLYLIGKIDFTTFRADFVKAYLSSAQAEEIAAQVNCIESACDDFSEKMIGEAVLRGKLVAVLPAAQAAMLVTATPEILSNSEVKPMASATASTITNVAPMPAELVFAAS